MASELRRPLTRTGSGSRPPTSRFQEGSMNDRISAAPPAQFLGAQQLKEYEDQFLVEPPTPREARRQRPFSATAIYQHVEIEEPQQEHQQSRQRPAMSHKKSTSFFGRVRDALFHRGGGQHGQATKTQEVRRKHSSLQEPLQHPLPPLAPPPPPPRPDYHAGRTQSEVNIAQMFPNPRGATDRPSREDVLASYNQLVSSGFFQSHAIQSTRHAAPGRQTPVLPMDHPAAAPVPRAPVRISSITSRSGSASPMPMPMPSPNPQGRSSREYAAATMAAPAASRSSLSSLFRPSIPDLHTKDSWLTLRGRKRTRGDGDETPTPEPHQTSSTTTGSGGYFAQPLRRVAKKLREMPSSSSQLNSETIKNSISHPASTTTTQPPSHNHQAASSADGVVRLVPSVSFGGSVHPNERPIRLRSPSPEVTMVDERKRSTGRPTATVHEKPTTKRPRKTFSYTLTESARGRSRTVERERGRERDKYRVQRRGSSATRPDSKTRGSRTSSAQRSQNNNPLGQWQRVSLEDTVIHRDSTDSAWSWGEEKDSSHQEKRQKEHQQHDKVRKTMHSPLQTMPDANHRGVPGVPAVPKAPERWHGTGKAYHLKDRGSRPDLAAAVTTRRSVDSGRWNRGKENVREGEEGSKRRVDGDGDVDVLAYEKRAWRQGEHQNQWHIGNAL
ncbi:hypothetical protein F4678DRAFT_353628 [Xylaria arbuscula]|nr:hypothetical protein F4678DRAFT_353628 [Xylaria arbuscula]